MNPTSLNSLIAAAERMKRAQIEGTVSEADNHALFAAAFDVFGWDAAHEAMQDTAPPEQDFFGNPVHSMQARIASAQFDDSKYL